MSSWVVLVTSVVDSVGSWVRRQSWNHRSVHCSFIVGSLKKSITQHTHHHHPYQIKIKIKSNQQPSHRLQEKHTHCLYYGWVVRLVFVFVVEREKDLSKRGKREKGNEKKGRKKKILLWRFDFPCWQLLLLLCCVHYYSCLVKNIWVRAGMGCFAFKSAPKSSHLEALV